MSSLSPHKKSRLVSASCRSTMAVGRVEGQMVEVKKRVLPFIERISPGLRGHSLMGPAYEFGGTRVV